MRLVIGHWLLVIGHWSLVISKEAEERGREKRLRKGAGDSFAEIGLAICDLDFGFWDFTHLPNKEISY